MYRHFFSGKLFSLEFYCRNFATLTFFTATVKAVKNAFGEKNSVRE